MSWLARLIAPRVGLHPGQHGRLAAWRSRPVPDAKAPFATGRFVVVDVESSGLDPTSDRLLAIGAVVVADGRIDLAQSFEVVLRQEEASHYDNILVHGITGTEQTEGREPADALLDFLDFAGRDPLVAFHAGFDRIMLQRACKRWLGLRFKSDWLDLAFLAPALCSGRAPAERHLDAWLGAFGIPNHARHNALADAVATAQLLLVVLAAASGQGMTGRRELSAAERAQQWLERR